MSALATTGGGSLLRAAGVCSSRRRTGDVGIPGGEDRRMPKMPPRSPNTRGRGLKPSAPSAGMDGAGPSSVSAGDPDVAGGRAGEANRRWTMNPRRRSAAFYPSDAKNLTAVAIIHDFSATITRPGTGTPASQRAECCSNCNTTRPAASIDART